MIIRKFYYEILGRTALALAAAEPTGGKRTRWLESARSSLAQLERRDSPGFEPRIDLLRAGIDAVSGDFSSACCRLERAASGFSQLDEGLGTAITHDRLARMIGGDVGRKLHREAREWMTVHGAAEPAQLADAWAPGFAHVSLC